MRRAKLAVPLTMFVVAALPAPAAPPKRECGPPSATTVKRDRSVRVYFTQTRSDFHTGPKRYYACARRGGKPIELGDSIHKLVLRGSYVSFVVDVCDATGCSFILEVVDVPRNEYVAYARDLPGSAEKLVATRNGEAAALGITPGRSERYIVKLDSMGISEIDRGPEVRDLTLQGSTLHWLNGPWEQSAPIAHVLRCGRTHGVSSLALGRRIRVYSVSFTKNDTEEDFEDYYACVRPGGKPVKLARIDVTYYPGSGGYSECLSLFAFAGNFLAFARIGCTSDYCDTSLSVFDVERRRLVRQTSTLTGSIATVVVSTRGGAGALVSGDHGVAGPPGPYVLRLDSTGQTELDRGPDVRSLTLDGSTLRWLNGSDPRSAELH